LSGLEDRNEVPLKPVDVFLRKTSRDMYFKLMWQDMALHALRFGKIVLSGDHIYEILGQLSFNLAMEVFKVEELVRSIVFLSPYTLGMSVLLSVLTASKAKKSY